MTFPETLGGKGGSSGAPYTKLARTANSDRWFPPPLH